MVGASIRLEFERTLSRMEIRKQLPFNANHSAVLSFPVYPSPLPLYSVSLLSLSLSLSLARSLSVSISLSSVSHSHLF